MKSSEYTIGWICAIYTEYVAAVVLLDEEHQDVEYEASRDSNTYTFGKIGKHMVVIALLPDGEYGLSVAATVAKDLLHAFPNVRVGLMVGIGGGAPSKTHDIRLGDVVVSSPSNGKSGVIQYDFGKLIQDQAFHMTGHLDKPPVALRTAIATLRGRHDIDGHSIESTIDGALSKKRRLKKKYSKPDASLDQLHVPHFVHEEGSCCVAGSSSEGNLVLREPRDSDEDQIVIHYGLIASSNQLMKDAMARDRLSTEQNVLCFEMEAAGLMNWFPCIVIRGICDYSDSHKNKDWQGYAAMTAAAYAKELLYQMAPNKVEAEKKIGELAHESVTKTEKVVNEIRAVQHKQDHHEILDWLTEIDCGTRHSDIFRHHQPGTGQWLLESEEFQKWLSQDKQTLFCSGDPGAGKTVLSSVVGDHLLSLRDDNTVGIALIYCNYKEQLNQTVEIFLCCLLKQLCEPMDLLPKELTDLYASHGRPGMRPSVQQLSGILHMIIAKYTKSYLIIDALDECDMQPRESLLKAIFDLQYQGNLNIFATSRKISEIEGKFEHSLRKEVAATDSDIRMYAHSRLEYFPDFIHKTLFLKEEIISAITKAVGGMFLLARLYLDSIGEANSIKAIRDSIRNMATGADAYDQAYMEAIQRIQGQSQSKADLAIRLLIWIAFAKVQLPEWEVRYALSVDLEATDFDEEGLVQIELASTCAGLVTRDEESKQLRLIHYTTQKFLERHKESLFPDAEAYLTNVCLARLSFQACYSPKSYYATSEESCSEYYAPPQPLYLYAAKNWGYHAGEAYNESQNIDKILSFLKNPDVVQVAADGLQFIAYTAHSPKGLSGLHLAVFFDLERATSLLCDECDVNTTDSDGNSPLAWAIKDHHDGIVRILVEKGALVDLPNGGGRPPLAIAASRGYKDLVQFFIEKGASVDIRDEWGHTALSLAARDGYEDIVQFLFEKGASVDIHDIQGRDGSTALSLAARGGYKDIVQFLFEKGASIDDEDEWGQTALSFGAVNGYKDIVEFLIEKGASIDQKDKRGNTPLLLAARTGHGEIVNHLVERGASIHGQNEDGDSASLLAAMHCDEDIVRLLVEKGASVNIQNKQGDSMLGVAAQFHLNGLVRFLIGKGAFIDLQNQDGKSPLALAASHGYASSKNYDTVRYLIEEGAFIDMQDQNGDSPLAHAAMNGYLGMVRLLIAKGASINMQNKTGCSPLTLAAQKVHHDIISFLIEKGAHLDVQDQDGNSPLTHAVISGEYEASVRNRRDEDASTDLQDQDGDSSLTHEVVGGKSDIDLTLDKDEDASIDLQDQDGNTSLTHEVVGGKSDIDLTLDKDEDTSIDLQSMSYPDTYRREVYKDNIRLFIEKGASIDIRNKEGKSPLTIAVSNGDKDAVQLLVAMGASIESKDSLGRTPLACATRYNYRQIVRFLIEKGAAVDDRESDGRTPLFYAAEYGHERIINVLIDKGAWLDAQASDGRTALFYAAGYDRVRLLIARGAEVGAQDDNAYPSRYYDGPFDRGSVMRLLIEKGASVDAQDSDGRTPLFYAAEFGHENIMNLLIDKGASVESTDDSGLTPLLYAVSQNSQVGVRALVGRGALSDTQARAGQICMKLAIQRNLDELEELLIKHGVDIPEDALDLGVLFIEA